MAMRSTRTQCFGRLLRRRPRRLSKLGGLQVQAKQSSRNRQSFPCRCFASSAGGSDEVEKKSKEDTEAQMPAEIKRQIAILVGSQLMLNIGVSQVVPVLPLFAQQFGLGASGVGLLIALPSVAISYPPRRLFLSPRR